MTDLVPVRLEGTVTPTERNQSGMILAAVLKTDKGDYWIDGDLGKAEELFQNPGEVVLVTGRLTRGTTRLIVDSFKVLHDGWPE